MLKYEVNLASPAHAATPVWNRYHDPPKPNELPLLRTSSDFAWAFRNLAIGASIKNIQKIMSVDVVNDDTVAIIDRALQRLEPPRGQARIQHPQPWPGKTFVLTGDSEGLALLGTSSSTPFLLLVLTYIAAGSPNGLGAGYFLAQHKSQLGGNKVISKITVWVPEVGAAPTMLFWVADELEAEDPDPDDKDGTGGNIVPHVVVNDSSEAVDAMREHVFRTRR